MDLNKLLSRHQVALYNQTAAASREERRWASLCAAFYADEIGTLRRSFGRFTPLTTGFGGVSVHG